MAVRLVVRRAGAGGTEAEQGSGVQYVFEQPRLVIGRSPSADLRLPALTVSDLHATLEQTERGYSLRDTRSTNGTRVNGTALVPERLRALHEGDLLQVGEFEVTFHTGGPVTGLTTPERTVSLARRLLQESVVEAERAPATVQWQWAGTAMGRLELPPPPARWLLGSAEDADLRVPDEGAEQALLELEVSLDGLRIRALGSEPVEVNRKTMRERSLRDGDRVQCGAAELLFEDPADRALRALEGQADAPLTQTVQAPRAGGEPSPQAQPAAAPTEEPPASEPEATPPARKPSLGPDAVVYALALLVLAASAVGMVWLLGE